MKVLIINGSPRGENSNTMKVTRAFVQGMSESADIEVETVTVKDLKIEPCLGCFCCWSKTPGKCVIKDDVRSITLKILSSDLVIYSFPLFYYSVPGKLKALIERQLPTVAPFMEGQRDYLVNGGHPPRFTAKHDTILISTCGFYPTDKSYDAIRAQFGMICGEGNFMEIFLGEGELFSRRVTQRRCQARLEAVHDAGVEYGRDGKLSDATHEKICSHLYPPTMYAHLADEGWGITMEDFRKTDEETVKEVEALGKKIDLIY